MEEILYLVVVTVAFIILLIMFIEFMKMMLLPVVYLCGYICDVLKISKLINWAYEGTKAKNGMNMVEVIEDKWSLIYETPLVAFVFLPLPVAFLGGNFLLRLYIGVVCDSSSFILLPLFWRYVAKIQA